MKKFCIILMILTIIIIGSAAFIKNNETHTEYLRIHIRADSNEAEAQAVKYEVKGEVVKMLTPYLAECRTKAQAEPNAQKSCSGDRENGGRSPGGERFFLSQQGERAGRGIPHARLRRPHP